MPKVVSRSAVSSSTDGLHRTFPHIFHRADWHLFRLPARPTASSTAALRVYCVICPLCLPSLASSQCVPPRLHLRRVYCASLPSPAFPDCAAHAEPAPFALSQLVIDKSLTALPRRQTDGATVIRCQDTPEGKARVFKLNATPKDPVLIERCVLMPVRHFVTPLSMFHPKIRQGGHEKQYRFHCPRCALPVAYQSTPPPAKSGTYLYIFKGALSQIQGQVPPDAFEDEKLLPDSTIA